MSSPAIGDVSLNVDLLNVSGSTFTVRNRASGREATIGFDGVSIGANESGEGYTLILPSVTAQSQGLADAH